MYRPKFICSSGYDGSKHTRGPAVLASLAAALLISACAGTMTTTAPPARIVVEQPPPVTTSSVLRKVLAARKADFAEQLQAFYAARDFQPAWTGDESRKKDAADLYAILAHAHEEGLRDEEYLVGAPNSTKTEDIAAYDIALSESALRFARDMQQGRVFPATVYEDVELPVAHFDGAAGLAAAVARHRVGGFFAAHEPVHPGYGNLVVGLARYRAIADEGGWPTLPGNTEIRIDSKDARIPVLVKRLSFEDHALATNANPSRIQIVDAVKRFQARHGLPDDGRVGGETLAALNVPATVRVAQIAANMERWRWLPAQLESRYVMVNAAAQSVEYVRDGKVVLTSRVIVGRKTSQTPLTRSEIQAVIVNPPWNIPGDIAARDLLPRLKQNPNYLVSKRMVLTNGPAGDPYGRKVDWRKIEPAEFPYAIRQLPGPATALGSLMLDSPNDFDVYLHDTPGKQFFAVNDREISNGCVRVQQIFPLASLALKDDPDQGLAMLRQAVRTGKTQRLELNTPLPVYFLYWTAIADADGNVQFRPDHYSRDPMLIDGLNGKLLRRPAQLVSSLPSASSLPADAELSP